MKAPARQQERRLVSSESIAVKRCLRGDRLQAGPHLDRVAIICIVGLIILQLVNQLPIQVQAVPAWGGTA